MDSVKRFLIESGKTLAYGVMMLLFEIGLFVLILLTLSLFLAICYLIFVFFVDTGLSYYWFEKKSVNPEKRKWSKT